MSPGGPSGGGSKGSGSGSESGLGARLAAALGVLESVVSELDPSRLTGADATELYGSLVGLERLTNAGKTLLAPRIEASGIWRERGHRNAPVMLAALEGVGVGQAQHTLVNGQRLEQLPGTEAALRTGTLSGPKVTELTGAGVLAPERETALLEGAAEAPLQAVRERCQRSRATSGPDDPSARVRRIREARHFSSWTDPEGAFCYQGRDTPDRGAQILAHLGQVATRLRRASRSAGDEAGVPERAVRADAFYALVTRRHPDTGSPLRTTPRPPATGDSRRRPAGDTGVGSAGGPGPTPDLPDSPDRPDSADRPDHGGGATGDDPAPGTDPSSIIDGPPTCSVVVRVDLDALLRGQAEGDECCEIDTLGPIPVPMARDLANDSFLRLVFHRAGDIRAVSHLGRTINRTLRTALVHRDTTCVVPGCGTSSGLEIDHIIPFAEGGPTTLDNLALLCHHHHFLKTFEGWTLERIDPPPEHPPDRKRHHLARRTPTMAIRTPPAVRPGARPRAGHSGWPEGAKTWTPRITGDSERFPIPVTPESGLHLAGPDRTRHLGR